MGDEKIPVDWTAVDTLQGRSFATGKNYKAAVKRESIPLVFIPGIMGSRLRTAKELVWDPNNTYGLQHGLARRYGFATPAQRKAWLIDDNSRKVVEQGQDPKVDKDFFDTVQPKLQGLVRLFDWIPVTPSYSAYAARMDWGPQAAKIVAEQGWIQVAWSFYGDFLMKLSQQTFGDYTKFFMFPVYAIGYDWVANNKDAGLRVKNRITQIIQQENGKPDRTCKKVIVITHSMGGLVGRSAVRQGAGGNILGVIHGAQPVTGAPAAYRRMRAGFESDGFISGIQSDVMGAASKDVMPVLANCIGGLELLPTDNYHDNTGSAEWLKVFNKGANQPTSTAPKGSPYAKPRGIYAAQSGFTRLIYHRELLTPASGTSADKLTPTGSPAANGFPHFLDNLAAAQAFHKDLGLNCHPFTYHMYTKGGKACFHQIRFRYYENAGYQETDVYSTGEGIPVTVSHPPQEGSGTDLDPTFKGAPGGAYFKVDPPDPNSGDGTVPWSSASALKGKVKGECTVSGVEHGAFYSSTVVQAGAFHFVELLAQQWKQVRKPG